MEIKILDCPHGFGAHTYICIGAEWHMITVLDLPKHTTVEHQGSKRAIGSMTSQIKVTACMVCGVKLDKDAPVRNYVPSNNPPLDEQVTKLLEANGIHMSGGSTQMR